MKVINREYEQLHDYIQVYLKVISIFFSVIAFFILTFSFILLEEFKNRVPYLNNFKILNIFDMDSPVFNLIIFLSFSIFYIYFGIKGIKFFFTLRSKSIRNKYNNIYIYLLLLFSILNFLYFLDYVKFLSIALGFIILLLLKYDVHHRYYLGGTFIGFPKRITSILVVNTSIKKTRSQFRKKEFLREVDLNYYIYEDEKYNYVRLFLRPIAGSITEISYDFSPKGSYWKGRLIAIVCTFLLLSSYTALSYPLNFLTAFISLISLVILKKKTKKRKYNREFINNFQIKFEK